MSWFNAMATEDERLLLKPAKAGHANLSEGEPDVPRVPPCGCTEARGGAPLRCVWRQGAARAGQGEAVRHCARELRASAPGGGPAGYGRAATADAPRREAWRKEHEKKSAVEAESSGKRARSEEGP